MSHLKKSMILLLVMILSACGMSGQNDRQNTAPEMINYSTGQAKNTNTDRGSIRKLAGGPEAKVRKAHPVSNALLQRKYPKTVVLHGSRSSNKIALTFDDGPSTRYTPKVLDILDKYNAKATFFLLGSRAKALPKIVKRIHDEGHAIGNHTYWHSNLTKEGVGRLDWGAKKTNKVIENIVGYQTSLFRPPYGNLNDEIVKHLQDLGLNAVIWSVDSLNWKELSAQKIEDIVLNNVQPGDIILIHDAGNWNEDLSGTIKALKVIIPKLQKDGMKLVTVPELLGIPGKK